MKKSVREYVGFKVNGIISKVKFGCEFSVVCFGLDVEFFTLLNLLSGVETARSLGMAFTRKTKDK